MKRRYTAPSRAGRFSRWAYPQPESFAVAMTRFGVSPDIHIMVYSSADLWWATRGWWLSRVFDFNNVAVLD